MVWVSEMRWAYVMGRVCDRSWIRTCARSERLARVGGEDDELGDAAASVT
jgi:hypothetical protein